jgi:hypothetical protein
MTGPCQRGSARTRHRLLRKAPCLRVDTRVVAWARQRQSRPLPPQTQGSSVDGWQA